MTNEPDIVQAMGTVAHNRRFTSAELAAYAGVPPEMARAAQKLAWEAYVVAGFLLYTPEAKRARAAYLDATEAVIDLNLTLIESNHQPGATMINPKLPRDIRQVKVQTHLDPRDLPKNVESVTEVYITDVSCAHHYCSAERLAWMLGLRYEFEPVDDLTEAEREAVGEDAIEEGGPEDTYMNLSRVKDMPHVRFEDDAEDSDDDAMEAAREYFQGNWQ